MCVFLCLYCHCTSEASHHYTTIVGSIYLDKVTLIRTLRKITFFRILVISNYKNISTLVNSQSLCYHHQENAKVLSLFISSNIKLIILPVLVLIVNLLALNLSLRAASTSLFGLGCPPHLSPLSFIALKNHFKYSYNTLYKGHMQSYFSFVCIQCLYH